MLSVYILEFFGTTILSFFIFYMGKRYAHLFISIVLFVFNPYFVSNCFNPAIAICYFLNDKFSLITLFYYIIIEISGAACGFYLSNSLYNK